jgi:hypothetical protein
MVSHKEGGGHLTRRRILAKDRNAAAANGIGGVEGGADVGYDMWPGEVSAKSIGKMIFPALRARQTRSHPLPDRAGNPWTKTAKPCREWAARSTRQLRSGKQNENPSWKPSAMTMILGMLLAAALLLAGCSTTSTQYKSRPFFLTEEEVGTHGRKAWYDRIVELDPGGAEFTVAADYQQTPPKKIAVLPFTDLGQGEFVVNKIPLLPRSDQERARWDGATQTTCAGPSRAI